jgi:hypothetical protein
LCLWIDDFALGGNRVTCAYMQYSENVDALRACLNILCNGIWWLDAYIYFKLNIAYEINMTDSQSQIQVCKTC